MKDLSDSQNMMKNNPFSFFRFGLGAFFLLVLKSTFCTSFFFQIWLGNISFLFSRVVFYSSRLLFCYLSPFQRPLPSFPFFPSALSKEANVIGIVFSYHLPFLPSFLFFNVRIQRLSTKLELVNRNPNIVVPYVLLWTSLSTIRCRYSVRPIHLLITGSFGSKNKCIIMIQFQSKYLIL